SPRLVAFVAGRPGWLNGAAVRSFGHGLLLPLPLLRRLLLMLPLRRLRWLRLLLRACLLRGPLLRRTLLKLSGRHSRPAVGGHRSGSDVWLTGGMLRAARLRVVAGADAFIPLDVGKHLSRSGIESQQGGFPPRRIEL